MLGKIAPRISILISSSSAGGHGVKAERGSDDQNEQQGKRILVLPSTCLISRDSFTFITFISFFLSVVMSCTLSRDMDGVVTLHSGGIPLSRARVSLCVVKRVGGEVKRRQNSNHNNETPSCLTFNVKSILS